MLNGKVTVTVAEAVSGRTFECYVRKQEGVLTKQTFSVMEGCAVKAKCVVRARVKFPPMLRKVKALFALMAEYLISKEKLLSKGSRIMGTPSEFAGDLMALFRKAPDHFSFIVLHGAKGDTPFGYVCAYPCDTGGNYIKHVIVDKTFSGLNFGALLVAVAEWHTFVEQTTFKIKHAKDVSMGLEKAETAEDIRRGKKLFLNFAGDVLLNWYGRLGYVLPRGSERAMTVSAIDKAHPVARVKQIMDNNGAYLGTTKVLVGVSIPCPDAVLSALPTPDAPLIESPRGRSRTPLLGTWSPSPTTLLGKRSRSPTPLLERSRLPTPLLERSRSPTPLLERSRSPTPLLERSRSPTPRLVRGAVRPCPAWYVPSFADVFREPPVLIQSVGAACAAPASSTDKGN
jgi:hypothetical protein